MVKHTPDFPPPAYATARTESRETLGPMAGKIAKSMGITTTPAQQYVLDVSLELLPEPDPETGGLLAYRDIIISMPRQAGKSIIILIILVFRAVAFAAAINERYGSRVEGPQKIIYTAQGRNDARKKWDEEFIPMMERWPALKSQMKNSYAAGKESTKFLRAKSRMALVATTTDAGHGGTEDLILLDEGFALPDARMEQSLKPTLATRPNGQYYLVSAEGDESSLYLNPKIDAAIEGVKNGVNEGTALFLWRAPEGAELDDPDVWKLFHPAVGFTQNAKTLMADALAFSDPLEAMRAYFNWRKKGKSSTAAWPGSQWSNAEDVGSSIVGRLALAFDMNPESDGAAVAVSGLNADGVQHISAVDQRVGTAWLPGFIVETVADIGADRVGVVKVDDRATAGSKVADVRAALDAAGFEDVPLEGMSANDYKAACGAVYTAIREGGMVHQGDPFLNAAADSVKKLPSGNAFVWARKSGADITALCAATIAAGAFVALPEVVERADYADLFGSLA